MFEDTKVLAKTSHYYARLHRESIEIHKHENNFNKKEESLKLNKTLFQHSGTEKSVTNRA